MKINISFYVRKEKERKKERKYVVPKCLPNVTHTVSLGLVEEWFRNTASD